MTDPSCSGFEGSYGRFKDYSTPRLKPKHIAEFDKDIWSAAGCAADMSMLEIGCGTGLFLAYMGHKKVADFVGVDQDETLAGFIPEQVADHFRAQTVRKFLETDGGERFFDRVFMFEVLEHFTFAAGAELLRDLRSVLKPGGRIVLKLPNMSSPWGAQYQFGDLTHRAAYTPLSIRQLAQATGYDCLACRAQPAGSPFRRLADGLLGRALGKILMAPPEIWTANFLAILQALPAERES